MAKALQCAEHRGAEDVHLCRPRAGWVVDWRMPYVADMNIPVRAGAPVHMHEFPCMGKDKNASVRLAKEVGSPRDCSEVGLLCMRRRLWRAVTVGSKFFSKSRYAGAGQLNLQEYRVCDSDRELPLLPTSSTSFLRALSGFTALHAGKKQTTLHSHRCIL